MVDLVGSHAPRDLAALPKAHLHLHFTGSMRHSTLVELAERDGLHLPEALLSAWPPKLTASDSRGWFRFQQLYDVARSVLRTDDDVYRLVREAACDDVAEGSRWLELQVDPSGYGGRFGGMTRFLELVLDAAKVAASQSGLGVGIIVAANRTRHPLDARALARLAAKYAEQGVVGFGLSNDERRGVTADFAPAFTIARRAGLILVPHGGELRGPESAATAVDQLGAHRLGHGVRVVEDPELLDRLARQGVACEVCPTSNVALGVYPRLSQVPVPTLLRSGVRVALGADDPLLFGDRLTAQYAAMRSEFAMSDAQLAELAAMSLHASRAPQDLVNSAVDDVSTWLRGPGAAS